MKKILKRSLLTLLGVVIAVGMVVGAYMSYVYLQYHRLPDQQKLTVNNNQGKLVQQGQTYKVTTFNIGYGSYPADFSFFMDGGKEVRARSRESVQKALTNDQKLLSQLKSDFTLLQEVDVSGNRSQEVNEVAYFQKHNPNDASSFAQNYDSAYLFYPVTNPIGQAKSGLLTLSKYHLTSAKRYQLPIETNFNKFFDLDRAFSVNRFTTATRKELVLVNVHLSAYIRNQIIQEAQLHKLFTYLDKEAKKGNYVICGGDYNHVLKGQVHNELTWMKAFPSQKLPSNLRIVAPNTATVRNINEPYNPKTTTTGTIDGFILSKNVTATAISILDNHFAHSDHQPVTLAFTIN